MNIKRRFPTNPPNVTVYLNTMSSREEFYATFELDTAFTLLSSFQISNVLGVSFDRLVATRLAAVALLNIGIKPV